MAREAHFAHDFYAGDLGDLQKQIENCFEGRLGPGATPISKREKTVIGAIVPQTQYFFGGQCAAWAYKEIAEAAAPDVYILLCADHKGSGSAISDQNWQTPFGEVVTDKDLAIRLEAAAMENSDIRIRNEAHKEEHAIEVQLPMLVFANQGDLKAFKILPIIVGNDINYRQLSNEIKAVLAETKKQACVIACTDFTRYGVEHNYTPFIYSIKENVKAQDLNAIEAIKKVDPGLFVNQVKSSNHNMDGAVAVATMLDIINEDVEAIKPLCYYQSPEILEKKEYKSTTGYASVIFR